MATFVEFATTVETKHDHVIDQLNLDMVIGFLLGEEDHHNYADVYLVDGDSFRAWKEHTDPFWRLAEKQQP
jgi:hypothetical protein